MGLVKVALGDQPVERGHALADFLHRRGVGVGGLGRGVAVPIVLVPGLGLVPRRGGLGIVGMLGHGCGRGERQRCPGGDECEQDGTVRTLHIRTP